jgi:hypothetical protein
MASRRDYYYRELVTEAELDAGFEGLEAADRALVADLGVVGVYYGLGVGEAAAPNLTVDVDGGAAYDASGQRCRVPSAQNVNLAVDSNNTSTAVSGVGNEKWVSVFVEFARALSDQRTDGNSNTVWFVRDESFAFRVVQGAEAPAGTASRPALLAGAVLLADVKLVHSQTQVLDADVSTTRRQWAFSVTGAPRSFARGRVLDVLTDMLTYYNNHVTSVADLHPATAVNYAGGPAWADGTTNPAATAEAQFDKVITDLGSGAGTAKIHGAAIAGTAASTVTADTLYEQLVDLRFASFHEYGGGSAWLDGTTNPAASVEAQLDKVITDLVGQGASTSGAHKLGIGARTTWLGGRTNPATTIFVAIDKVITDLALTSAGDDGAERIGFNASGNISATDVGAALRELDAEKAGLALANTWTSAGSQTFQGPVTYSGSSARQTFRTNTVGDANATIDVTADTWTQSSSLTAARTITVRNSSAPVPASGERIRYTKRQVMGFYPVTMVRESDGVVLCVVPPYGYSEVEVGLAGSALSRATGVLVGNW